MKQKYFAVLTSEEDNIGKLKIYGVIGDWWDSNTANDFLRAFQELEQKFSTIHIHINSPGGSVHEGLPIINAIKASSRDVHTFVDGIAFSMGAMIYLAAKKNNRHMATGSLIMLHNVSTYIYGNAQDLRVEADVLDKYDDTLGSLLVNGTGKTLQQVRESYLNHKDNYFTPEEALAEGLTDTIESYESQDTPANVRNMTQIQVAAWYNEQAQEPSESFMSKITSRLKASFGVDNNSNDMFGNKFSKLGALAKVAVASITAQHVEDVNAQIVEAGIEGLTVVLDSELESKVNLITTLEKSVSDKDALIAKLEGEVKALGGKPAGAPLNVVTDKTDAISTGQEEVVDDFMTDYDREAMKMFGK